MTPANRLVPNENESSSAHPAPVPALIQVNQARNILRLDEDGTRVPLLPPLARQARVWPDDPLSSIQFGYEPSVCTPAVVLFADLRGYTRMCERLAPGQVVLMLREYFALLAQITLEHHGAVFNTAGDCLMAAFDLSTLRSEATDRALKAARVMLSRFASLAESWWTRFHVIVGLGLGLNTGEVAIAPTGFPSFTHYTLIGDTVNVAARLCQRARAGEIVLSASFKQNLSDMGATFAIASLSQMAVRGRTEPVHIFCLPLEHRSDPMESLGAGRVSRLQAKLLPA